MNDMMSDKNTPQEQRTEQEQGEVFPLVAMINTKSQ